MRPSPGLGDLLVWDGRPHRLAVALLFELSAERLLDVVHVEGADGRTGDAAEETRRGSEVSSPDMSASVLLTSSSGRGC